MQLFILIFLLSHVAMVTAVAGCQSDRDKDHRPRQNCTAGGFSDVPAGLEPSNKVLLFPNNLFSSLSWSSFQIFTDIYEIDLTGNKVPEVTPSASPVLPSLSVLRLCSNRLTSLSDGAFSACPALTELYLDNNAIRSLSDHTFSGLSKLEILDLSSNHIKVLPGLMLHPLTAIETLFLENNKINVMPDNWFSQKEEVPYLYLSANPWACSCSLGYLRTYLDNYEFNVYVRDGPIINSNAESVVCDSPRRLKGKPVLTLEESDLCSSATEPGPPGDFYQPVITNSPQKMATSATAVPTPPTTMTPPPPPPTTTSPPPPPPPLPTTTTSPPPPPTTAPALAATPALVDLHTEHHRVVTWSWHQSFTRLVEWSVVTKSNTLSTHRTPPTARPSTESPADMTTATSTPPAKTTKPTPTSTTAKLQMLPTPTTTPPLVMDEAGSRQLGKVSSIGGAAVFCFWLFAGCFLLCVASAACILTTVARLVSWYRRVYRPLSETLERRRRRGGYEAVRLLGKEVGGGEGGAVNALYRSVLFIHQERPEAVQGEDGGKEGEGGEGGEERLVVPLEPPGGGGGGGGVTREEGGQRKGMEERGVYRKTMYRLLSKEEEIEGWRDVMEECRVSAADGGRRGAVKDEEVLSTKRYSVILREERGAVESGSQPGEVLKRSLTRPVSLPKSLRPPGSGLKPWIHFPVIWVWTKRINSTPESSLRYASESPNRPVNHLTVSSSRCPSLSLSENLTPQDLM
uniref:platelet glycoprotein Ib alpha chain n=1 Tax=Scatophagus argus TaxID=75038 RepID=UPI001ED8289D|nr:platelet glycoprotein Ib alpha chain [Scatophagus argus]